MLTMKIGSPVLLLLITVIFALVCTSCASSRPTGLACNLDAYTQEDIGPFPYAAGDNDDELNVLALSAGGEYGAYGTGFLRGWAETPKATPISPLKITVVTGVSTGAIMATHMFLGRYDEIDTIYRSISGPDIYKSRGVLGLLFGNSFTDASGKTELIAKHLSHEIIDAVAAELKQRPGRQLLAGTVDLESGTFLRVDLGRLAADRNNPNRDECFRAVVGAASAIPLAFPPIFVDKRMLVDGGLRHYSFMQNLDDSVKGPLVKRRLFAIYHGDLVAGRAEVRNGILPIAQRMSEVAVDQLLKDTAYRLDYIARFGPEDQRFETYYLDVMDAAKACLPKRSVSECAGGAGNSEDMFCHPFMECLSDRGRIDGKRSASENKWVRELMTRNLGSGP
jgi:hypothetical protein